MALYKNKFRIESIRLKDWNYSSAGVYFVTICAKDQKQYFGAIHQGTMQYSSLGIIAYICWRNIKNLNSHVDLLEFIIMPNHIHGIIVIKEAANENNLSIQSNTNQNNYFANISPKAGSLSAIIRSYKSAVTKYANHFNLPFQWHARFYEHIITYEKELNKIRDYIVNNPTSWENDQYFNNID